MLSLTYLTLLALYVSAWSGAMKAHILAHKHTSNLKGRHFRAFVFGMFWPFVLTSHATTAFFIHRM
jgi:hypothetical protein